MTAESAIYRRVLRRETHSPRTAVAVAVASLSALILVAAIALSAWWVVDETFRRAAGEWLASAPSRPASATAGALALVLAAVLIAAAVLPGRLARRARIDDRVALLVDDGVLADAVADAVASRCAIARGQVSVRVGRRIVDVRVTPISGVTVDHGAAEDAAASTLGALGFASTPRLTVARRGTIS